MPAVNVYFRPQSLQISFYFLAMQNFRVGLSPCPNDTFMFDALLHNKINLEDCEFTPVMDDVQQLNERAMRTDLEVTKMSFFAYTKVPHHYKILNAGSALGKNCGPILISKKPIDKHADLSQLNVCIPGANTTANLLLSIFYPEIKNKTAILFSDIENALLNDEYDAGLIIHENRFTYELKGLNKIVDLGEAWQQATGYHIPLGCIVVKRSIDEAMQKKIDKLLHKSVKYAFSHPDSVMKFVRQHAQEMDEAVMKQHIVLYVNNFSIDLGVQGKAAIAHLFKKGQEVGLIGEMPDDIFV